MRQYKSKPRSINDVIRRRIQDWRDEDPSSLLTKQIQKATEPLQWLVSLMLPDSVIAEAINKTLWAAEVLTDRDDILRAHDVTALDLILTTKIDRCDALAEEIQKWSVGAGAALGAWDLAGPLGTGPALISLFTLAFRTIKKIGLCYGYDTSTPAEELIVLEIFVAASTLYHREKVESLRAIENHEKDPRFKEYTRETVEAVVKKVAELVGANLTKRRSLATVPALGALVGGSSNAWLLHDIGTAARNIYANRRLVLKAQTREKNKEAKIAASVSTPGQSEVA